MNTITHFLFWKIGLLNSQTQTSQLERDCLSFFVNNCSKVVEIGVWHGVTTCVLRKGMNQNGVLFAVDPYYPGRLGFSFQKIIAHCEVENKTKGKVQWLEMTGVEAAKWAMENGQTDFDFVFIDGDHSYEGLKGDWESWSPLVTSGGIIALHDSVDSGEPHMVGAGSLRYTREVIHRDPRFKLEKEVRTLSVFRKI
jgi:predicted O-methyltransferase YrrM